MSELEILWEAVKRAQKAKDDLISEKRRIQAENDANTARLQAITAAMPAVNADLATAKANLKAVL